MLVIESELNMKQAVELDIKLFGGEGERPVPNPGDLCLLATRHGYKEGVVKSVEGEYYTAHYLEGEELFEAPNLKTALFRPVLI